MKRLKKVLISTITICTFLFPLNIAKSEETVEIITLIKTTTGIDGKKISYPRWNKKAELRLYKITIPVGKALVNHTHPAPMIIYIAQGELKHTSDGKVNYFSEKESLVESNKGKEHELINIGKNEAILFVAVSSALGLPVRIHE